MLDSILGRYTGRINTNTIIITDEEGNEYMETDLKQIKNHIKAIYEKWYPETKTISIEKYPEWKAIYELKITHMERIQQSGQIPIGMEKLKKIIKSTANNSRRNFPNPV